MGIRTGYSFLISFFFRIKSDLKYSTFLCGLLIANSKTKREFYDRALEREDASEQSVMLSALAGTADQKLLNAMFEEILKSDSKIRDKISIIDTVFDINLIGVDTYLDYLLNNEDKQLLDET